MGINVPIISQQTDSYCGPAVIQMLLAHCNRTFSQDDIVQSAEISSIIEEFGMQPDKMAKAISKLAPEYNIWFKQNTTRNDLAILINNYNWPVGINWQGLFYDTVKEQLIYYRYGDNGHYSIVSDIDILNDKITIIDPYPEYSQKPRKFSLAWFEKRWWDKADILTDEGKKIKNAIRTNHLIFIIAPKNADFPKQLDMHLPHDFEGLIHQESSVTS